MTCRTPSGSVAHCPGLCCDHDLRAGASELPAQLVSVGSSFQCGGREASWALSPFGSSSGGDLGGVAPLLFSLSCASTEPLTVAFPCHCDCLPLSSPCV